MKKVTLSLELLNEILKLIPSDSTQERRVFTHLAENGPTDTVGLNQATSTGNLSHVARKLNNRLIDRHLMVSCERPPTPIPNKFGEASQMFIWSLYQIPNEGQPANDPTAAEQAS